jgi:hypothetical protein
MPLLDPLSWSIWLLTFCLESAAAVFICKRGFAKRWPSLVSFLAIKSAIDLILIGVTLANFLGDARIAIYFDIYWGGNALAAIAEMWMVIQIGVELISASPKAVRWVLVGAPLIAATGVFVFSFLSIWPDFGSGPKLELVSAVVGVDRIVALSWLATFLCIAAFSDLMGIRWRRHPFGIAIGFAILSTSEITVSWFIEYSFHKAQLLSEISGGAYLLSLASWCVALAKDEAAYDLTPQIKNAWSIIFTHRSIIQRLHAK